MLVGYLVSDEFSNEVEHPIVGNGSDDDVIGRNPLGDFPDQGVALIVLKPSSEIGNGHHPIGVDIEFVGFESI